MIARTPELRQQVAMRILVSVSQARWLFDLLDEFRYLQPNEFTRRSLGLNNLVLTVALIRPFVRINCWRHCCS